MANYTYAIVLTLIAGSSTIIGAILGILNKKPSGRFVSFIMASSAGVMVFLSFTEMFNEAVKELEMPFALLAMGLGLSIALVIDMVLPEAENVHEHLYNGDPEENIHAADNDQSTPILDNEEIIEVEPAIDQNVGAGRFHRKRRMMQRHLRKKKRQKGHCDQMFCVDEEELMKLGILTVLALFIHNVPEGLATFSASIYNPQLGIEIAFATALHNIPEGICVAVPIYVATRNKKKALFYASVSGMAEPAGAIIAWLILPPELPTQVLAALLGFVAGIMIYVSVDTLIPTAKNMEYKHTSVLGFSLGMFVMGISLIFI